MENRIKYLIMDVDGTLTDGKIYMGDNGELFKAFDVKDGCGIKDILSRYSIKPVIITARQSTILVNRCAELNIDMLFQGVRNKKEKLEEILQYEKQKLHGVNIWSEVAYIGDDILDIQCMQPIKEAGGLVGCPNNAAKEVVALADFISTRDGGNGAVREFIEWICEYLERV